MPSIRPDEVMCLLYGLVWCLVTLGLGLAASRMVLFAHWHVRTSITPDPRLVTMYFVELAGTRKMFEFSWSNNATVRRGQ